tara:strand:+ start:515 stop:1381 length:867 start_codon:yes stop_codon:yes gene_type:complete
MYNKIINPETGRSVSINGKIGKLIIKKYLDYFIGGTSKDEIPQDDIPMNNYESLKEITNKEFAYQEFASRIEKLYSDAKTLQIKSFHEDDVDKILNTLFDIKRFSVPQSKTQNMGGGIYVDKDNNIIKMMRCPMNDFYSHKCIQTYFINEIFWMVNLYKMGLSPEFISVDFVKLEFDGKVNLYGLAKLKKHTTFKELYDKKFYDSESEVEDNIMGNEELVKMFNDLFKMANFLDLYVMTDLHLNNIVMNLTNDGLLLIDTIPEKASVMEKIWKLDFTNKIDDLAWEFP